MQESNHNLLNKIRSKHIFKDLLIKYLDKTVLLNVIRYNKKLKAKSNVFLLDYFKLYNKIEILIKIRKNYNMTEKFINTEKPEMSGYHIYINKCKRELKNKKSTLDITTKKVHRIKIIIDRPISNISNLFSGCKGVREIEFKTFHRVDFEDLSFLFGRCENLSKVNISKLKCNNLKNMVGMFDGCNKLKTIYCSRSIAERIDNRRNIRINII